MILAVWLRDATLIFWLLMETRSATCASCGNWLPSIVAAWPMIRKSCWRKPRSRSWDKVTKVKKEDSLMKDFTICVGTVGAGVWYSPNGGEKWRRSKMNLPFHAEPGEVQIRALAVYPQDP